MLFEEYKHKKVLVTGHTGFKGGWLAIWLNHLGADVAGYSLDPMYEKGIFQLSGVGNKIIDYRGDIRNIERLLEVFDKEQPEIVFHLAAQAIVLESYENPVLTFETNTQGTVNVLEAIRLTDSVHTAVIITTDKCYENQNWIWGYRETDPMGGFDPYSSSKGAAELVIQSYRRSFFMNDNRVKGIASARAGNVIGGGDWSEYRLIPDIIKAIETGSSIKLRNPHAIRPWQHVIEPLGGYLKLGLQLMRQPEKYSSAWNFGPYTHEMYTVKEVAEKIISVLGQGEWEDLSEKKKLHEANLLVLDINKAIKGLGWRPVLNFTETIELTSEWYKHYKEANVLELSIQQIEKYCKLWKSRSES